MVSHDKAPTLVLVTLLLASLVISSCYIHTVSAQSNTIVNAQASTSQPQVGSTLTVAFKISNVQNLAGIDATLRWNASVLSLYNEVLNLGSSHSGGVLLGSNLNFGSSMLTDGDIYVRKTNVSGSYELAARTIGISIPGFSGSGTIATLTFNVINIGAAALTLKSNLTSHPSTGQNPVMIDHQDTVDSVIAIDPIYPPTWTVQTVDTNGAGGGLSEAKGCFVAVDSNNMPHIAYTYISITYNGKAGYFPDGPNWIVHESVNYASWNGSNWIIQTVSSGIALGLVLDASGSPHILYSGRGLMYASWTGSSWNSELVDLNGAAFGVVALDSSGNPHVAYTDGAAVKYASQAGSNWAIQTVDIDQYQINLNQMSLAIDPNNIPYIFFDRSITVDVYDNNTGYIAHHPLENLQLATWQNSNWTIQTIANATSESNANMVLDPQGYAHLIYQQDNTEFADENTSLIYANWTGDSWNMQTVASNVSSGYLALDRYDYPHITAYASSGLVYASWTGKSWDIQNTNASVAMDNFALDSNGNPHISWLATTEFGYYEYGNVEYATAIELQPIFPSSPTPTSPISHGVSNAIWLDAAFAASIIAIVILLVVLIYKKNQSAKSELIEIGGSSR